MPPKKIDLTPIKIQTRGSTKKKLVAQSPGAVKLKFKKQNSPSAPIDVENAVNEDIIQNETQCVKNAIKEPQDVKKTVTRNKKKLTPKKNVPNRKSDVLVNKVCKMSKLCNDTVGETKVVKNNIIEEQQMEKKLQVNKKKKVQEDEPLVKRSRLKKKTSTCEVESVATEESKDNKNTNTTIAERPTKKKRKLPYNRKLVKAGPKPRTTNFKTIAKQRKYSKETIDSVEKFSVKIYNRKKSDASSEMSWTKDISSSSPSLISKDFYLIDNKVPTLQLSSIDTDLRNHKYPFRASSNCVVANANSEVEVKNCDVKMTETPYGQLQTISTLSCSSRSSLDVINPVNNLNDSNLTSNQNDRLSSFNLGAVTGENAEYEFDILCPSLNLSASSTSSSSSSSTSSCTSSSTVYEDTFKNVQGNVDEQLISQKTINSDFTNKVGNNKNITGPSNNGIINKGRCIRKLGLNMKTTNLNAIKLSRTANDAVNNNNNTAVVVKEMLDKLFTDNCLKEECNLICLCLKISQMYKLENGRIQDLNDKKIVEKLSDTGSNAHQLHNQKNNIFGILQKNHNVQQPYPYKAVVAATSTENNIGNNSFKTDSLSSSKINYTSLDDNDDDDALSLFAESITGLETNRRNSTFNIGNTKSVTDEYIPQPLFKQTVQPLAIVRYQPTKIVQKPLESSKQMCISTCEKQIPDSTSIFSESSNNNALPENPLIYEDRVRCLLGSSSKPSCTVTKSLVPNSPRLMASIHKPLQGIKSYIFNGLCFFHIVSTCKKRTCNFPHVYVTDNEMRNKLSMLSEELFIQEYMRMRRWPKLRRRYGLHFLEECMRRELTRILLEMGIDFIMNANNNSPEDRALQLDIIDNILMYLNNVDLCTCDDLLKYKIKSDKGTQLCDVFMSVIATSQNFSRFKSIFIDLTKFVHQNNGRFTIDVAESILERICILPYDQYLTQALLVIMRNTDVSIFSNSKIGEFERQLLASNKNLYDEFKFYKTQADINQPALTNCYEQMSPLIQDSERINTNLVYVDKNTRYSPDTTDLDNANKTTVVTTFTRTIDVDKLKHLNIDTDSSLKTKKKKHYLNNTFKKWSNCSVFDHLRSQNMTPNRPLQACKRRSEYLIGDSPAKFHRKSGPKY